MNSKNIKTIIDKEGICNLIFDAKDQDHNLFNKEVIDELSKTIDLITNDPKIIGVIISSQKNPFIMAMILNIYIS